MSISITSLLKSTSLIFLFIIALYFGKNFLMPLSFGVILATLFLPFCKWMEKINIPKTVAVVICLITNLLFVSGIISVFGWKISEMILDVGQVKEKMFEAINSFQQVIFKQFDISISEQFSFFEKEQSSITNIIQNMAGSISSLIANLILIYLYFIFLLYYRGHIKNFLLLISGNQYEMENIIQNTTKVSQQYLIGLSKIIICLWIMYSIGFSIIGVKNAIFFAILCGFMEIIPYIGNIFGTIITIIVASIQGGDVTLIVSIALVYGFTQIIQGWLLEPFILGPQVKINPLMTIIVLVFGNLLWGISGIILAIPLTAVFKIICDHFESLKPYGFLIGEIKTERIHTQIYRKKS